MTRVVIVCALMASLGCAEAPVAPSARGQTHAPDAPPAPVLVQAVPAELDLGTVFVGSTPAATVRLFNTSETPLRVAQCTTSCKCTATDCPAGADIAPGGSLEITVTLDAEYPRMLTQRVTIAFEGSAPVHVPVSVKVLNYLSVDPPSLDPDGWPDGNFAIRSNDGQTFRVLGATPAVLKTIPPEAGTEHQLAIDWGAWDHATRLLRIDVDHPLVKRVQIELAPKPRDVPDSDRAA